MKDANKLFGQRLRKLRRNAALTQKELGDKAGIHPTYISMMESGRANITLEKIGILALCLGISVNDFFSQEWPNDTLLQKNSLKNINILLKKLKPAQVQLVQELVRELSANKV